MPPNYPFPSWALHYFFQVPASRFCHFQPKLSSVFWKLFQKESKEAAKNHQREKRRAKRDPNRKKREPTGFALATPITSALCQFLELPAGSKLSRTEATKKVTAYIKAQNLQNPQKKRSFVPDAKLSAILGPLHEVDKTRGYDYFNLQRYMKHHFIKTEAVATA